MRRCYLLTALFLFIMPFRTEAKEREVYVAIGDSLAAGQTPYSQIDAGYTDFIAMQLQRHGKLAHFTKELSFPGYRIGNVLESAQSEKADALLKDATLITISAGANNLLPLISYNANAGTLAFSQLSADFALNEVRIQMRELLELLHEKAPAAEIYVMGYYFPYVSIHEEQVEGAEASLNLLNRILQQEAEQAGAHFIDVYDTFNEQAKTYLSNLSDIHPNQQGYRLMANVMLEQYSGNASLEMRVEAMPKPNPLTFEEILSLRNDGIKGGSTAHIKYVVPQHIQANKPQPLMD
ncbi:lysophospholipase [Solibacillus sp. R5-41]|uniref:SGNH/GDSL hydrolase family protein n=1 Tax=Solibacillus sp. R5-41 TaxID=2048654 RepID=UPI000C125126|nr:SGNH/GDSL hydrolase family protein [Solibacillus sp. R5-41]ATP41890.1 lysophospholipase [Solibacillus sp. R5-41]